MVIIKVTRIGGGRGGEEKRYRRGREGWPEDGAGCLLSLQTADK